MDIKTINLRLERAYLDKLLEVHNKHINAKSENVEKISKLEGDNEELRKRLSACLKIRNGLEQENLSLQTKLESAKQREKPKNVEKYFHSLCELLGYFISDIVWDEVHRVQYIECYYNKSCYVRFSISSAGLMDCLEIVPHPPDIEAIKEHFRTTQEATNLLALLRQYFNTIETIDKPL